uniref:Uncharacterized protein n=1 Tax=Kalanchoe fedtschenkoi TaxID=63787 RepID=A0A7N0TDI0_KALFE
MAKSTRMLVFILFHIITVMICYGSSSSKTPFDSEVESEGLLSVTPQVHDQEEKEEVEACAYGDMCDEGEGGGGLRGEEEEEEDGYDEEIDDVWYDGDDEYFDSDDDEESHGDLRGRIEEFIGRVNRTWKEELLKEKKLLCLVEDTESLYMLVPYEMV